MAGPETPLALGQQGIDDAMLAATSQSMGIAGAEQPVADTRGRVNIPPQTNPAGQGQFAFEMQPADYGYRMTQDDFGQRQVAQHSTASGTLSAPQQGYPFPALAGRQSALAERKAQLQMAFDPFKGISDPADPYQTTFNQYIRDEYWRKRNDMAQASFGGDTAAFDKWAAGTPEGQMWMRTNFTMPMDAIAKENKGRVEKVAVFLEKARAGDWDLSPEDYKALQEYTTLINDIGAPLSGSDGRELLLKGRAAEMVISKVQYQKRFLTGFNEFAQEMPTEVTFERPASAGGKIVMKVKDTKVFDDYIDAQAQQAVDFGMFEGSKQEATDWMRKLIKNKYDMKVSAFDPYESVERKEAAKAKYGEDSAQPSYTIGVSPVQSADPTSRKEELSFTWSEKVGNKVQQMGERTFKNPDGTTVELFAPYPTKENGFWVIRGRVLDDSDKHVIENEVESWANKKGMPNGWSGTEEAKNRFVQERKVGRMHTVPYSANRGEVKEYTGIADLNATYLDKLSKALASKGISATPEELAGRSDEMLKRYVKYAGL